MKQILSLILLLTLMIVCKSNAQQNNSIKIRDWKINGITREAMVYIPTEAVSKPRPILFIFHGHGENMKQMFDRYHFERLWPEAIIIAPQGLNTPGKLVDKEGKYSGWQQGPGFESDRDILFFDTILNSLNQDYNIDKKQVFATGHSNGGSFTYLLWAMRGDKLAAIAPSAAVISDYSSLLKPKPVMHIMGENDRLARPMWQKITINRVEKINHCTSKEIILSENTILYPSAIKTPLAVYTHPGGHVYPNEACAAVVRFFKYIGNGNF